MSDPSEINYTCGNCGSEELEIIDSGKFKGISWVSYICLECGNEDNTEPDYD